MVKVIDPKTPSSRKRTSRGMALRGALRARELVRIRAIWVWL